jgi:hypothetical protein
MVRKQFGYKKMFDNTLESFKRCRDESGHGSYRLSIVNRGITDAISYDPCLIPEYYHEFYYVPPGERKFVRNYRDIDDVRRCLDYPYYFEKLVSLDEIFSADKNTRVDDPER